MKAIVYVDGGSRQEGKHATIGVSLCAPSGKELLAISEYIGPATSNQAEYAALLRALTEAHAIGITELIVFSDSRLVVGQVNNLIRCESRQLKPLHQRARQLARRFYKFSLTHVCREDNQRADDLAGRAFAERRFWAEVTADGTQ